MAEEPLTPDASTRAADLFQSYAEGITRRLGVRFPGTDPQTVSDAAVKAILWLSDHPEQYDPGRGPLGAFLGRVARCILARLLRAEGRRRRREQKKAIDPVTAAAPAGQPPLDELADRELAERMRASLNLTPRRPASSTCGCWVRRTKACTRPCWAWEAGRRRNSGRKSAVS